MYVRFCLDDEILEHFLTCYALKTDLCEVLEHLEDL